MVHRSKISTCFLVLFTSMAMLAQETGTAVLFGTGTVFLNGAQVTTSSAVSSGDVIQTKDTGAGNITVTGSSAVIEPNSIVRYREGGFALDRGNISLATIKGVSVFARDFKISPASGGWTEYYVTRSNGSIGILARKNSLSVTCGANTVTVKEGQQISRDDAADCGLTSRAKGAPAAAVGPILTPAMAEYGALGAGAVLAGWALIHNDNPVSPDKP